MRTTLQVHYGRTASYEQFLTVEGPAVAVDGFVCGHSVSSVTGRHVILDHHCPGRLALPATCEQAAMLRDSRWATLHAGGGVNVWLNDSDPDASLSVWALRSSYYNSRAGRALLAAEGEIDRHGGVARLDRDTLDKLSWVFEPWAIEREFARTDDTVRTTIEQIADRADMLCQGRAGSASWAMDYEQISCANKIIVAHEHGPLARTAIAGGDYDALVAVRDDTSRREISVLLLRPCDIDLVQLWPLLSRLEPGWGGSDTIGGSPRDTGTQLDTDLIVAAIHSCRRDVRCPD